ncbi:MAG TPA: arginine--tRNA ligase [Candidatus Binatia bacterium]|nr:arginine--tRNA ligase [Candidatus Binatia bacterium]
MKDHLESLLRAALGPVLAGSGVEPPAAIAIDAARGDQHGDFASNLALVLAKPLRRPPRDLAQALVSHLPASPRVARVEIAGPGFINFFLTADALHAVVPAILAAGSAYGRAATTRGRILVEFVSANPTGPLHVGHGRGAAYGDALSNLLDAAGYEVLREYYINDAGRQVDVLAVSVWLRALELQGERVSFPARGYPGDYVRETAQKLLQGAGAMLGRAAAEVAAGLPPDPVTPEGADDAARDAAKAQQEAHLDALIARAQQMLGPMYAAMRDFALNDQLERIRATLESFGVRFDRWFSERELVQSGAAERARAQLVASGHTYEQDGALWFRTTAHGDDKDRVLVKANGQPTYFGNDLAYHVDKLRRAGSPGHAPLLVDVWGADHHGLLVRMRAAMHALTGRSEALRIPLMQFVTLAHGRMGKRSGNFVTLDDLLREAGRDATRFFYLLRSHDQHLEFDLELARAQSNDNPVFYVQYACARAASVFRQAGERGLAVDRALGERSLSLLVQEQEKVLLQRLARLPELVQDAAAQLAPHQLAFYAREVADAFHGWYNAHPFLVDDAELRNARLALVAATGQVLKNVLGWLGVSAPERMERLEARA